jgi:hypothetical protein
MALPLSVSMLRLKRDQIRDTIVSYEAKLRESQADLAHVLATLRLFDASGQPADFPPYMDLKHFHLLQRAKWKQLLRLATAFPREA